MNELKVTLLIKMNKNKHEPKIYRDKMYTMKNDMRDIIYFLNLPTTATAAAQTDIVASCTTSSTEATTATTTTVSSAATATTATSVRSHLCQFWWDFLFCFTQDTNQFTSTFVVCCCEESDCNTVCTGTTCTTDLMDIIFCVCWEIMVDNISDILDICLRNKLVCVISIDHKATAKYVHNFQTRRRKQSVHAHTYAHKRSRES